MTRTLVVALLTLGDPGRLTGGYLYHRRMAEAAPWYDARIDFVSFPERPFPLAARDVAVPGAPVGALRYGRRAAGLCGGNWVARKVLHSLLDAFARLPAEAAT